MAMQVGRRIDMVGVFLLGILAIVSSTPDAFATPSDGTVVGATQLVNNGPDSDRFTTVIVAEGFQATELNTFAARAQDYVNQFLSTPPFDTNQSAFNFWRIDVSSTDTGADDPVACGGSGAVVNTYFDASFCNAGIRRLLVVNNTNVINVLNAQVPSWNLALVIVNSTVYGGAGGMIATTSLAGDWGLIAIHETGHSGFGLADEYEYWAGCGSGETDRNNHPAIEPLAPNVTIETNRNAIKWSDLILPATAVPTTTNSNCAICDPQPDPFPGQVVGLYEGAHYYHCDAYRPVFSCMMRNFAVFCPVCSRAIVNELGAYKPTNRPPVADAGASRTVECAGVTTSVTLDGTGSSDPDGDMLTYAWSAPGIVFDDPSSATPTGQFLLGITTVTLVVSDGIEQDTDTVAITVIDTTRPTITVAFNRDVLWPPNHKMSPIAATVTVEDICDSSPTFQLVSITSNEPDNGNGDGNTTDDIQDATPGTADVMFSLRSERSGRGAGRTYTIVYRAADSSGNTADATALVKVPHDQSGTLVASSGFMPDGTRLVPGAASFFLVILARSPLIAGDELGAPDLFDVLSVDGRRACVGNHLTTIPALSSRYSDVDGDLLSDLVLEYASDATLDLVRLSELEPVSFRYESRDRTGHLVNDIFALGTPILLPGERSPSAGIDAVGGAGTPQIGAVPQRTNLVGIHPNPFNPATTVRFDLATSGMARIAVYNLQGVRMRTLLNREMPAGWHRVTWDGRDEAGNQASSGLYLFQLVTQDVKETRKAILMK